MSAAAFWAYFNVADELSDPRITLEHLDRRLVAQARKALDLWPATGTALWPPDLACAEEFALDHPELVRGEEGW